jgi:methyltransferase (TIGR00027 family)
MRDDRPSTTAALIAAATVFVASDTHYRFLVPVNAARLCMQFIAALPSALRIPLRALCRRPLRWIVRLLERATVPGLIMHFTLRKRFIESAVLEAIAQGATQVLIVGAGFDTLALRLHRCHAIVNFVELDHPATQRYKRNAIAGHDIGDNLVLQPFDLTQETLQEVLSRVPAWSWKAKGVVIVEGLLMYLDHAEVRALIGMFGTVLGPSSRIIFSVMESTSDGRANFHNATPLVRRLLGRWREPFKSSLSAKELPSLLHGFGFGPVQIVNADFLRERYLPTFKSHTPVTARGELVCVADRLDAEMGTP